MKVGWVCSMGLLMGLLMGACAKAPESSPPIAPSAPAETEPEVPSSSSPIPDIAAAAPEEREIPPPGELEKLCRQLDGGELTVRTNATLEILKQVERPRVGGTEQQMEAAGAFCETSFGIRPSWMPQR